VDLATKGMMFTIGFLAFSFTAGCAMALFDYYWDRKEKR